jgi:peptidoglycan/LPS O-acetylase OafA/YrhL
VTATGPTGRAASRNSGRIPQVDGLRGTAIALVLAWHYFVDVSGGDGLLVARLARSALFLSWSGVDLFFVISGFLIGGILLDNRDSPRYFRTFYMRRALRIFPCYALLLLPFLSARSTLAPGGNAALRDLVGGAVPSWTYVAFVQNFAMARIGDFGPEWMAVTWSLAVEEQFYLLLPLVLLLLPRRLVPHLCLSGTALALGLRTMLAVYAATAADGASARAASYLLLPTRADALLLGVLGAWLTRDPVWSEHIVRRRRVVIAVALCTGAPLVVASLRRTPLVDPLMSTLGYGGLALFYTAVLLSCLSSSGVARAVTSFAPLRTLGTVSYFVYLFHQLSLKLARLPVFRTEPIHDSARRVALTLATLGFVLATASASWRYLERPLLEEARKSRY